MTLRIGQKLWFVPNGRPWIEAREVTIMRLGRKWLYVDFNHYQICRRALTVRARKGYDSLGQCWLTKAEYERWLRRHGAWRHFRRQVQDKWGPPESVTLEQIQAASDLLRLAAYV